MLSGPALSPGADDAGDLCLDVGDARACWSGDEVRRVAKPLPAGAAPPSGWRCGGQGAARSCVSRALNGPPFACAGGDGGRCVQTPLRTPDEREWECVEVAGAVTCRLLADAAGVRPGAIDAAFTCGERRGSGERICVDLAPDPPPGMPRWACRVGYAGTTARRECVPPSAPRLGVSCKAEPDCPSGAACVAGVCLPPRPAAECWFDKDCDGGSRCLWGSCRARG